MGLLALCSFLIFFFLIRLYTLFIGRSFEFEHINTTSIATLIIAFISSILGILLAVNVYAEKRKITKIFVTKISLIYLIVSGLFTLVDIVTMVICPESRGVYNYPVVLTLYIATVLVGLLFMRMLLLRKAAQQDNG